MKMPTLDEARRWAMSEAEQLTERPTRERLCLLVMLHQLKQLESQKGDEDGSVYDCVQSDHGN